jgi:hypothetical protein
MKFIKEIKDQIHFYFFLKHAKLSDKKFLIELANTLDKAEYDNIGCMKMTKELVEVISPRLRKIGNRMVIL